MPTFPYSPMRILSNSVSDDLIYVFQPSPSGPSKLLALNSSNTFDANSLPYTTISPSLPFLEEDGSTFTPAIDNQGDLLVYAGDCRNTTVGSRLWKLASPQRYLNGGGQWNEVDLSTDGTISNKLLVAANNLASAVTFSATRNATSDMYIFGGMCPNASTSTSSDWIQAANYSNSMLSVQASQPTTGDISYDLGIASGHGSPIAEAGFTMTPLIPTFSGSGETQSQAQNQNFVLLGGHTQQAFINMSQVALFSLPQQSWTFVPVDAPSGGRSTDLTKRAETAIDSRSGHTAILTSDGSKVILFGGWVGDTSQAATPQFAVLELGEGYGGTGDWQWSTPSVTGAGLPSGTGLYGHGAVLLPGDVMAIVGGYQIPASPNSKWRRQSLDESSSTYFYNTTSNTWISNYSHPRLDKGQTGAGGTDSGANREAKRIGLGAGLTFGILALLIVVIVYFWYNRRLKKRREAREEELRKLAAGTHRFHLSDTNQGQNAIRNNEMTMMDWNGEELRSGTPFPCTGSRDPQLVSHAGRGGPEAERTGLLFEVPSPTRGLRRSLHARGSNYPTPRYEDGRRGPVFSTIHPIDERDEYDEGNFDRTPSGDHEMIERRDYGLLSNVPVLDQFQDPMGGSRTPSPQSPEDRQVEIRRWVSDWRAADALMLNQAGRSSPEKTDRTSSTLSDQSARSMVTSSSIQRSLGSFSRTMSQRSAALFSSAPNRSTNDTTRNEIQQVSSSNQYARLGHRRSHSLTLNPSPRHVLNPDTFVTATSSFPQPQSESAALLDDFSTSDEPSPTRTMSRARGWFGSVRRALTGTERIASNSPEHGESCSSSPTKLYHTDSGVPRRAASTGAMLWQKRKGARDWDVEDGKKMEEASGVKRHTEEDEDWDVESAVERRVVQVMFTVPKEKLRVVNRGPDGDGESILNAEIREAVDATAEHSKGKGKEED